MDKYLTKRQEKNTDEENICASSVQQEQNRRRKHKPQWIDSDTECWAEMRNNFFFCKLCNVQLKATSGKCDLLAHSKTKKHSAAANAILVQKKISESFNVEQNATKKAEIRMALFIVEHNRAFSVADHITKVCQSSFSEECAQNMTLGRTKATAIINNVVGKRQFANVCKLLETNKFSLCIDESTDLSKNKSLCLIVRVCLNFEIYDFFFGLLKVRLECNAQSLHELILDHFTKNNINYKRNMIGFAADGAAVMTGKYNSVAQLFKKEIPNLFIMKCVCHSLALCSSYACLQLPSEIETLARNIYNYIGHSPKRLGQFEDIQQLIDLNPRKMLHPSQTRWLSLESVVVRIIDLYEPLKIYFSFAANVDQIDTAKVILENLNETNKIYLSFLKYILNIINNTNKLFQKESTEIHNLYNEMELLFRSVLSNFIKSDVIKDDIHLTEFMDTKNFLEYDEVYLGLYAKDILSETKLPKNELDKIVSTCINFYIELANQILKRFDFNLNSLKCLQHIDPGKVMKKKNNSFLDILKEFPDFILETERQNLDSEFRELNFLNFDEIFENAEVNLESFWKKISEIKRGDSNLAFPVLSKFVQRIMILPHSTANVERIFSQVNLNKTKIRSSLDNDSLEGILFSKDYLKLNNSKCFNIKIDNELLKMCNKNMY